MDSEDDEILMNSCFGKENEGETDLQSNLKGIVKKMEKGKKKIKIDEEDISNDAFDEDQLLVVWPDSFILNY